MEVSRKVVREMPHPRQRMHLLLFLDRLPPRTKVLGRKGVRKAISPKKGIGEQKSLVTILENKRGRITGAKADLS